MYRLTCDISIGKFQFDFVTNVEIESSWKTLTDTCTIQLPRKIKWQDKLLKDEIKRGDEVLVKLGWDWDNREEFRGYVADVGSKIPVTIRCEDEMWKLKQTNITKAWRSVSLKELLGDILPSGISFQSVEADLGPFRINRVSVAKVLESLKEQYGLYSFFRQGVLYVGFPYTVTEGQNVAYAFEKNIIDDNLVFVKEDDLKIKLNAVSILPDGSQFNVELGDPDGELRTLHFFDLSESQLKASAEEQIKLLKYEGFRGDFETFGVPFVQHGDIANIAPGTYQERGGNYFIDTIRTTFGTEGFRRVLELGRSA